MPSFKEVLKQASDSFRISGHEDFVLSEEVQLHCERMLENLDRDSLRETYPDLDEVVPELEGVPMSHPAFQAAIEVAMRDAILADNDMPEDNLPMP